MPVAPPDSAPAMGLYVTDPARAVVEFGLLLAALPLQRALPTLFPRADIPPRAHVDPTAHSP